MGKIFIEGKGIGDPPMHVSGHLYLVFQDDEGNEWVIRGGPENNGSPYGNLVFSHGPSTLLDDSYDRRASSDPEGRGQTELIFQGDVDISQIWQEMEVIAQVIHDEEIPYDPQGFNSNTMVATILRMFGVEASASSVDFDWVSFTSLLGNSFWGSQHNIPFTHIRADGSILHSGSNEDEAIVGTSFSDRISGADGHDHITSGEGNDNLHGNSGNDTLNSGEGDDIVSGGKGDDHFFDGFGNDNINGGAGFDILDYSLHQTSINVAIGASSIAVESNSSEGDFLDTVQGIEHLKGSTLDDIFKFSEVSTSIEIDGGYGSDILDFSDMLGEGVTLREEIITMNLPYTTEYFFQNFEVFIGTEQADILWLSTTPEIRDVNLGGGDDAIIASTGNLKANGGAGSRDILNYSGIGSTNSVAIKAMGSGSDIIVEENHAAVAEVEGFEIFYGSQSNDCFDFTGVTADGLIEVDSYNGNDTMVGSSGDDIFRGGGNNDTFYTSDGVDIFDGGSGYDTFDFSTAEHGIRINCSSNEYKAVEDDGFGNHEFIWGGYDIEKISGSHYDDHMNLYFSAAKEAHGGAGNDTIYSGHVTRKIAGGIGDDVLTGVKGSTWMYGEDGNDHLVSWSGNNHMSGGEGDDIYQVKHGDTIYGFDGAGEEGGDVICLNGIDAMRYRGFQEVNGIGAGTGQIRFVELSNGNTQAKINNDGDSYAEYSFIIADGDTHASEYTMDDIFYL